MSFSKTWGPGDPAGSSKVYLGDDAIRDFKVAVQERLDKEHEFTPGSTIDDDTKCGQHREGSARGYYQGTTPTPLAGYLSGRLWCDSSNNKLLYIHDGTSFVAAAIQNLYCGSTGVLQLPYATSPSQTTDAYVVWDSDNDLLTVGTGSGRKTMVDTDSSQTLTNKTLTSPTISTPSISGGTANLVGGTLIVPTGTAPTPVTEGQITWDTDDDLLIVGTGSTHKTMADTNSTQTLTGKTLSSPTISNPTISGTATGGTYASATLSSPTIADFTNAQHNHTSASLGSILSHINLNDKGSNTHPQIDTHIAATSAHGVSGTIVGTSGVQTLGQKTLSSPTITSALVGSTMAGDPTTALGIGTKQYTDNAVTQVAANSYGSLSTSDSIDGYYTGGVNRASGTVQYMSETNGNSAFQWAETGIAGSQTWVITLRDGGVVKGTLNLSLPAGTWSVLSSASWKTGDADTVPGYYWMSALAFKKMS